MTLQKQDVFDKQFARRVSLMIESGLIGYKHYYRWADEIIMSMDEPPTWVLEISTVKYSRKAVEIVNQFVYSEPFEFFDNASFADEYVACLFLRYTRGEIAWATFLREAGSFTDGNDGQYQCEDFYSALNLLEDNEFSNFIEQNQRSEIEMDYSKASKLVQGLYIGFREHFRRYVAHEQQQAES